MTIKTHKVIQSIRGQISLAVRPGHTPIAGWNSEVVLLSKRQFSELVWRNMGLLCLIARLFSWTLTSFSHLCTRRVSENIHILKVKYRIATISWLVDFPWGDWIWEGVMKKFETCNVSSLLFTCSRICWGNAVILKQAGCRVAGFVGLCCINVLTVWSV